MGQQALASPSTDTYTSHCVYSRPFSFDNTQYAVLNFKLHFNENCDGETSFKTEYRSNATSEWETIDSSVWCFGTATWKDIYLQLPDAGDRSRLRFTAFTDGGQQTYIDNVNIIKGSLIQSSSDNNGNINPRGYSVLGENDTITYTMTPLSGYQLKSLKIDGKSIANFAMNDLGNGAYSYKLYKVTGQHSLMATFEKKTGITTADGEKIKVYPNPADNTITINTFAGNIVTLYDIMGKQVLQQKSISEVLTIDIQNLPKGIYLLRDSDTVVKVIKK